jgi:hypothetical protein
MEESSVQGDPSYLGGIKGDGSISFFGFLSRHIRSLFMSVKYNDVNTVECSRLMLISVFELLLV